MPVNSPLLTVQGLHTVPGFARLHVLESDLAADRQINRALFLVTVEEDLCMRQDWRFWRWRGHITTERLVVSEESLLCKSLVLREVHR